MTDATLVATVQEYLDLLICFRESVEDEVGNQVLIESKTVDHGNLQASVRQNFKAGSSHKIENYELMYYDSCLNVVVSSTFHVECPSADDLLRLVNFPIDYVGLIFGANTICGEKYKE